MKQKLNIFALFLGLIAISIALTAVYGYRQTWWNHLDAFSYFYYATIIAIINNKILPKIFPELKKFFICSNMLVFSPEVIIKSG